MKNLDVTVIIRASGERTTQLCKTIIETQIPTKQVFLVKERPFAKAVQRTFEIGLEQNRAWTLAVDADILISSDAVSKMIEEAESVGELLYVYQGFVVDKIFGRARAGGPHLYNTKHLKKALTILTDNPSDYRPESDTYAKMAKEGFIKYGDDKIFGVHDYFQYRSDLFRKAFFHSKKHFKAIYTHKFIEHWKNHKNQDEDYITILHGWFQGVLHDEEFQNDITYFQGLISERFTTLRIEEKSDIKPVDHPKIITKMNKVLEEADKSILYRYISPKPNTDEKIDLHSMKMYKRLFNNRYVAKVKNIIFG